MFASAASVGGIDRKQRRLELVVGGTRLLAQEQGALEVATREVELAGVVVHAPAVLIREGADGAPPLSLGLVGAHRELLLGGGEPTAHLHDRCVEDASPQQVLPRARHAGDPHRLLRQDEGVFGASQHLEEPDALQKRRKAPLLADLVEPLLALAGVDLLLEGLRVIPADVAHQ